MRSSPTSTAFVRRLSALSALVLAIWLLGVEVEAGSARGGDDGPLQAKIRECANRVRARHGLSKLHNSKPLNQAASLHAHDMTRQGFFDHVDPAGRDPGDRVELFASRGEFDAIAENIAAGYGGVGSACNAWMNSSEHRVNILNPRYSFIGGGFARGGPYGLYYVQVFADK